MPDEPEENSLDGGVTNAGQQSLSPDEQSLGGGATYAGGQKSSLSDLSLGGGSTLGDRPGEQETVIDNGEVVDLEARYKVEGTLGRGGMGEVLLALDTRLDRKVAIKRILGEAARSKTAVERFLTEAKSVAAINHPNVVQIYDYGRAKDGPFLIMEYVDGSSLLDRCRDGALPEEDAIDLACQLCDGLGKAHDLGIIHRDIKPANVLLTKDGLPKLTDFGLAKAEASDQQMTMTGAVLGTPDFMPPEQRRDVAEVDARSDLWSLAATLYQMVTGRSPKIIRFDLLPASLMSVLGTALEESKGDRFQTAKEFRDALKASQTAAEPAAADLGEGQCPACGVKNESARKFCRGCGESLEVPCLSCEKPMPMWEEICGQCGSKQTPLVEQRRGELSARQAEAESLLKDHRFEESEAVATELRDEGDPRLKQLVPWATDFLPQIAAARDAAVNRAAQLMQDALKHEASHDYPAAVSTLALVPESLQQRALPGCSERVAQVIARVLRKSDQVKQLEERINEGIRQKKVDGLLTEVDGLAALRPDRKDVRDLQEKLRDREKKKVRQRDVAVKQAKKFLVTREYDAAVAALRQVDRTAVTEEVTKLRAQAEDLQARLRSMLQTIQEARAAKRYDGLIDLVKEAIAFGPENAELTTLLVNLESREEKVATEIAERIARFDEALAQCDYKTAFETLNVISGDRRNDEVQMRLDRVESLGVARGLFYDAIARLPNNWKRQEAEEINLSRIANQGRSYLSVAAEYDIVDQQAVDWCEKLEAVVEKQRADAAAAEKTRENIRRALMAAGAVAAVLILIMIGLSVRSAWRGASIRSAIAAERWEDALRLDSTNAEAYLGMAQDKLAASPPDIKGAFSDIDNAKRNGIDAAAAAAVEASGWIARGFEAFEAMNASAVQSAHDDAERLGASAERLRGLLVRKFLLESHLAAEKKDSNGALAAFRQAVGVAAQEAGDVISGDSFKNLRKLIGQALLKEAEAAIVRKDVQQVVASIGTATLVGLPEFEQSVANILGSLKVADLTNLPRELLLKLPPIRNSVGMDLKLILAGTFVMGDAEGDNDETPHEVTLTQPFYLGVTEVTNAQWQAVMGSVPSDWKDADHPVEQVSWEDAVAFCKKLSAMPDERAAGREYRLPTEAEWEYACRAGSTTAYSFGDDESLSGAFGWFESNSNSQTHPVGQRQPNAWGLFDMHGNVLEWCSDWYGDYSGGVATDPQGPSTGSERVYRGGSWISTVGACRSADRRRIYPVYQGSGLGFRVALSPSGVKSPEAGTSERRPGGSMAEPTTAAAGGENTAQPRANGLPSTVTNSVDVEMKLISAGTFTMGDAKGEKNETPHEVTLTQPFYLGVTEVTNAQWQAVMGAVPSRWKNADHPVEQVSWEDAVAFCKKLSDMPDEQAAGREYRLPTEAEWEYACRAGSTTQYSFGDDESLLGDFAWFAGNANGQTQPVGQRQPNAWGLCDMHGNVYEWCSDCYGDYAGSAATDPRGPSTGSYRVSRGGSWLINARRCRSALRFRITPSVRNYDLGFRLALRPSGGKPPEAGTSERRPSGSMAKPATGVNVAGILLPPRSDYGKKRKPVFVEVKNRGITLHPVGVDFEKVYGDAQLRNILTADIAANSDFEKLLQYSLREKDAIITLLLRLDAVEAYTGVAATIRDFELLNDRELVVAILPSGRKLVRSLSGVVPVPGEGPLAFAPLEIEAKRPPDPRSPPIDRQTGRPILERRDVYVKNGRVIPVIDPGDEMANAVSNRIKSIITSRRLPVSDDNCLPNAEAANIVIVEFNKNPPQLKNFEAKLKLQGKNLAVDLTPTKEAGETPQEAIRGWFRRTTFGTQRKYYLNFQVASDSFSEYLSIRKVMENEQFSSGWRLREEFSFNQITGFKVRETVTPHSPDKPREPLVVPNVID